MRCEIPLVVVCDDAVIDLTLGLIALVVIVVFIVAIFFIEFCCIGGILFTCGEPGNFQGNAHSAALFYNPNQDVRMTMQGDFERLLDDDGPQHINTHQIQRRSERQ